MTMKTDGSGIKPFMTGFVAPVLGRYPQGLRLRRRPHRHHLQGHSPGSTNPPSCCGCPRQVKVGWLDPKPGKVRPNDEAQGFVAAPTAALIGLAAMAHTATRRSAGCRLPKTANRSRSSRPVSRYPTQIAFRADGLHLKADLKTTSPAVSTTFRPGRR